MKTHETYSIAYDTMALYIDTNNRMRVRIRVYYNAYTVRRTVYAVLYTVRVIHTVPV